MERFLFLVLAVMATCVSSGVVIPWRESPSPAPVPSSNALPPWSDPSNAGDVPSSFIPLLRNGQLYNESVSVPITERTDTTLPLPAMIAAEDFKMPMSLQSCTGLVADLVLFRQLGRSGGNYRIPMRTTFWLFPDAAMMGPFNKSRALAERVFVEPSEGRYDPPGSTGGSTVDRGNGYYYHIERLRFMMGNLTLRANTTYWLAVLVSIDRAYNASDFSQNVMRWSVSEGTTQTGGSDYRVVDWHQNTFRDASVLINWTSASVAETYILPSMTAVNVRASRTRQLAMDIYTTDCTNVTRLPSSVTLLAALPAREVNAAGVPSPIPLPSPPTPSWNLSPTHDVVAVETPVVAPSSVWPLPAPTPPIALPVPSPSIAPSSVPEPSPPPVPVPSPPAVPSSVWQSPSPSLGGPSPTPTWTEAPSPSPSPVVVSSWMAPSPRQEPATPPTPTGQEAPSVQQSASPTERPAVKSPEAISTQTWAIVVVGAVVGLLLIIAIAFLAVRFRNGQRKYTNTDYNTYLQEHEEERSNESPRTQQKKPLTAATPNASEILLDDVEDEIASNSREDAKAKQDRLLMLPIPLDDEKQDK